MNSGSEYLVFGATGQQGGAVARALKEKGQKVRAFVRDAHSEKSKALAAQDISLVVGDLFDPASIDRAMTGITGVFSVQTSSPGGEVTDVQEVEQGMAIADTALRHRVRHLVYSSSGASGKGTTGMGHFDSKSQIESYVRSLPISTTITRPATFMEMLMLPGMGLPNGEITFFMQPDQAMQMIAVRDLGRVNAEILLDPERYAGRDIELSGASVTGRDLEQAFTRVAGRPIVYSRFAESLLASNQFLASLVALVDNGVVAGAADIPALEREFGPFMSLEDWLESDGKPLFQAALNEKTMAVNLR
ncbi:NmrA/HSCARG family protein (plasmid) [Agrobacterium sp. 33MFTa1.1]|uniref:NmrA/HSCARG family protein n=1 Tax=Agrobacterium sp. 33MFTa1.1 TaxID=1279031 RepID=UPI00054E943F|nr:NmrA/HSCARG family protein [Agrobacterium sp. 33MFTa1.1]QBJ16523.1 NmrA/HSCARG family protein [Agrobacterium sp. 33MFTa1.1]